MVDWIATRALEFGWPGWVESGGGGLYTTRLGNINVGDVERVGLAVAPFKPILKGHMGRALAGLPPQTK